MRSGTFFEQSECMKKIRLLIIIGVTVLTGAVVSCKSAYDLLLEGNDVPAKYAEAMRLFDIGKYSKSAALFESLKISVTGTSLEDTVNFYTALSHYRYGDVQTAESAFQSFNISYPRSPFAADSRYLYLDCLYQQTLRYELDQNPTYKAMSAISEYMVDYPEEGERRDNCLAMLEDMQGRLERKAYEGAKIYYTTEDYQAAHYAFRTVLKDNAETRYREQVLYYIALSSYQYSLHSVPEKMKERYMTFTDDYYNFISEYPESSYRRGLDGLYRKAQGFIKKVEQNKTRKQLREEAKNDVKLKDMNLKSDND